MIYGLVVFLAMAPMDCAGAMKISFLEQGHPWRAGHCELISDWGGVLSYGVGGASVLHFGLSFTTAFIFLCLGCASELGTVLGHKLTHRAVT